MIKAIVSMQESEINSRKTQNKTNPIQEENTK